MFPRSEPVHRSPILAWQAAFPPREPTQERGSAVGYHKKQKPNRYGARDLFVGLGSPCRALGKFKGKFNKI
jgi:hypothetical protein